MVSVRDVLGDLTCFIPRPSGDDEVSARRSLDGSGIRATALRRVGPREVGAILFLREAGFSLAEIGSLVAGGKRRSWQEIVDRKPAKLAEQQHRLDVALAALEHARRCPAGEAVRCSGGSALTVPEADP